MAYDKTKAYIGKPKPEKDYRQELTDKLIASMESAGSWEKPFFSCSQMPENPITGNKYKGINVISLASAGFTNPYFATFNQWNELESSRQTAHKDLITIQSKFQGGGLSVMEYVNEKAKIENIFVDLEKKGMVDRNEPIHVSKGEKGVAVFKAMLKTFKSKETTAVNDVETTENPSNGGNQFWTQVYAGTVFNSKQVNNIVISQGPTYAFEPHAEAELHAQAMISKTGLKLEHNDGGRAYYSVTEHKVVMPHKDKFVPGTYYDTLMHEFGHSTGKEMGRNMTGKFGSPEYAYEELIAELTSAFMSSELGIAHNPSNHENHAAYMKSWLGALKNDKDMIFKAASQAQKSADFQNFVRHEHKLDLGLVKAENLENEIVKKPILSTDIEKSPVLKKEKKLTMSM